MQLCYVDESGKADTLVHGDRDQQPVVVIGGIAIPEQNLKDLTHAWIDLKTRFLPGMASRGQRGWLDGILTELKGAGVRKGFRARGTRRQQKHSIGVIDGTIKLLERYDGRIVARVWVKKVSMPNDDMGMHASSLQFICSAFHAGLAEHERGMVVVDSQTYQHNHRLAHSMFTQLFGTNPPHDQLVDMPVFGHSDNHAGLQIADLLCSAVLAPTAASVYAGGYESWNVHCDSGFLDIRERFGDRLEALTFNWHNSRLGRSSSSVVVHDPVGKRSGELMWKVAAARQTPAERRRNGTSPPRKTRPTAATGPKQKAAPATGKG